VTTIRERDAELTDVESPEEWISHATWQAHADRRALLAAGDALAGAGDLADDTMSAEHDACEANGRCFDIGHSETRHRLRRALAAWKAATG